MSSIIAVKVRVLSPPISILTTQIALANWQKILFVGPHHFLKIMGWKGKSNH